MNFLQSSTTPVDLTEPLWPSQISYQTVLDNTVSHSSSQAIFPYKNEHVRIL